MCNDLYRRHLKRAEGEVDEVPGVAAAALHTFIDQHSEDHFMDSQQGNQDQCCSGQAGGQKRKHTVGHIHGEKAEMYTGI